MIHSTMNMRPFLLMLMERRFSSLSEGLLCALLIKIGDFLKFVNGKYLLGSLQVGIGD